MTNKSLFFIFSKKAQGGGSLIADQMKLCRFAALKVIYKAWLGSFFYFENRFHYIAQIDLKCPM